MEVKELKNSMRSRFAVHIKLGISSLSTYEGHLVSNEWWENPEAVLGEKGMRERVITALMDKIYGVLTQSPALF